MSEVLFADIIVDISIESLDKSYQYKIPDNLKERAVVGMPVMIPFGRGNRSVKGYIIGLSNKPKLDVSKIKFITKLETNGITATGQLLRLASWMKERYGSTMNEAIKTVLPVKRKIKEVQSRSIILKMDIERAKSVLAEFKNKKNAAARVRLLEELIIQKEVDYSLVRNKLNISMQTINSLAAQGIINVESKRVYRNPVISEEHNKYMIKLNEEQQSVVDSINYDIESGVKKTYLLHGVTGSGKTEVYMAVMEKVIQTGKQVIMLIPEIALTYQTVIRFYRRFGDRITVLNSRMSAGERYDQYERAQNGEIDIVIGPRSALFMPFENLGLIVIDEEHEGSYKSEMAPRYHAREVAGKRAELAGAALILGSATPSLETYYRTTPEYTSSDKIIRYVLNHRTGKFGFPSVNIIDMREEFKAKNYSMLSRLLSERISQCLERNEQVMLFINRRGYSGFVSCRSCGKAVKCPHCDVSLTVHRKENNADEKLVCHFCGYEQPAVRLCPECGSKYIGSFGTGTQKVEEMVKAAFPKSRVLRMDADTTTGKEGHKRVLEAFANHDADILVGTQMIVKGHDFPKVTLVGILAADMSLNISDFRSSERTFQLLVQAEGRAGRGDYPGNVVVQTYQPDHYAVIEAAKQDYAGFYEQEIIYRSLMNYPPVALIMTVFVSSDSEKLSKDIIGLSYNTAKHETMDEVIIIGPAPHPISKANDMFRNLMYLKSSNIKILETIRTKIEMHVENVYQGYKYILQFDLE